MKIGPRLSKLLKKTKVAHFFETWRNLITMQNVLVVFLPVCTHAGPKKKLGDAGALPLGKGEWPTSQKHATPHVLAHPILSLEANHISRGSQKIGDAGDAGRD